jgi:hypothetical protein
MDYIYIEKSKNNNNNDNNNDNNNNNDNDNDNDNDNIKLNIYVKNNYHELYAKIINHIYFRHGDEVDVNFIEKFNTNNIKTYGLYLDNLDYFKYNDIYI